MAEHSKGVTASSQRKSFLVAQEPSSLHPGTPIPLQKQNSLIPQYQPGIVEGTHNRSAFKASLSLVEFFFFFFAAPTAWGSSQARDQMCATAATGAAAVTMPDPQPRVPQENSVTS